MIVALARPEALLLLFVLLFSPLAFGTVEPWSHAIAQGAALVGLAIALRRRTHEGRLRLYAAPGMLPLLLFLGFLLVQCLPLPPPLLRIVSPAAHARWLAALGSAGPLPWLPLSLDPFETVREFFRFSACAAVYLLTVQLLARHNRLRAVTTVLAVFAAALSFEAILQVLAAPRRLLFIRDSPSLYSFGPFVNRNHYANLMAMLAPVMFGLFLARGPRSGAHTLRERLVDLLARRESNVRLLFGFATLLSAGSLVASLSRGAMVAAIVAALVFGGSIAGNGLVRRRVFHAAALLLAFAVFVGWLGWERVAERFSSLRANPDVVDSVRAGLWLETTRMAADFPVLGAGVGSFERLYPSYRTVPWPKAIAHAHNDHLELLAGGGVVGLGLFIWFVAAVLLAVAQACRRRRDRSALLLAFGSLSGCAAFLVHGASDFSLAIGANAFYFFFLLGLAVSASHTRAESEERSTLLGSRQLPAFVSRIAAALALAAVLGHGANLAARHAWNRAAQEAGRFATAHVTPGMIRQLIVRAWRLQPLESAYPAALARIAARDGKQDEALGLTRRALRRLPLDAGVLMQLGTLLSARNEVGPARLSFAAAVAADPAASRHRETFGAWLLSRGYRTEATTHLHEAMRLDPGRSPGIFAQLVLAGFGDDEIAAVVPPTPAALLSFARFASATGSQRLAGETYRRVLALEPGNEQAKAGLGVLGQVH